MKRGRKMSDDLDLSDQDLLEDDEEIKVDEDQQRFFNILDKATPEQKRRYDEFHLTYFYNPTDTERQNERFEGIVRNILGTNTSEDILLITAAAAKIYVGELIEAALEVSKENDDTGPIKPFHLQEARRRLRKVTKRIL
jgi:transcription initiation factor TFIID subunit 11